MGQPELVGSVLLAVEGAGKAEGTPFVQLKTNATLKGLAVFYPEQKDADPPVPYPWTISSSLHGADNCSILDVLLINPYQAVDFGGWAMGRHLVRNLYGQALFRGLFIDHCLDVGRVENVHLWPFWNPNGPAAEFTRREGKAFVIGRTDWQSMISCFCISYETGFHFVRCCGSHPAYQGGGNARSSVAARTAATALCMWWRCRGTRARVSRTRRYLATSSWSQPTTARSSLPAAASLVPCMAVMVSVSPASTAVARSASSTAKSTVSTRRTSPVRLSTLTPVACRCGL